MHSSTPPPSLATSTPAQCCCCQGSYLEPDATATQPNAWAQANAQRHTTHCWWCFCGMSGVSCCSCLHIPYLRCNHFMQAQDPAAIAPGSCSHDLGTYTSSSQAIMQDTPQHMIVQEMPQHPSSSTTVSQTHWATTHHNKHNRTKQCKGWSQPTPYTRGQQRRLNGR